jgi:hypothetical protein
MKMVGDWYDSSRTLKSAVVLTGVTFIVFLTAFFSPYWLQSYSSERLPNPKFKNLGKKKKTRDIFTHPKYPLF